MVSAVYLVLLLIRPAAGLATVGLAHESAILATKKQFLRSEREQAEADA